MALQINVGLNRKASEDFQSAGVSINLTAELDGSLLNHPQELQEKIAKLYQMAHDAVERQMVLTTPLPARRNQVDRALVSPPPRANGHNGRPYNGNGNGHGPRPATDKQKQALRSIARQEGVDLYATCRQTFGGTDFDQLTSWQASQLIDNLKASGAAR